MLISPDFPPKVQSVWLGGRGAPAWLRDRDDGKPLEFEEIPVKGGDRVSRD
jgi:hypothetical protein